MPTDPPTGDDAQPPRPRLAGTREILALLASGDPDETLRLREVLDNLGHSLFGMLLFLATLPAFLPVPGVAGGLSGPLVVLVGAQLLVGMRRPWLPRFIAERGPTRGTMRSFEKRIAPWLARLEHVVRPRRTAVLDRRPASMFTGLLLVLLGVLLALPIPLTNYPFGVLLMCFALALIERDGALMLVSWAVGIAAVAVFGVLSGSLAAAATHYFALWFG